ncbi:MAG: sn-glycerol-3-phosphate ABC transporter ATP-binding protein UgpC [Propionibacteriales bacterium]|nr:sn-glycerol-3-phosphate ABC transporter ATP-binding protein UgpC [Propionibacteriales bacterium]
MATVTFQDATRVYPGATHPSVDKLNLEIGDGEFMVLVGPSGCGKSTSLRMLAGLEEVSEGDIFIGDKQVTNSAPKDRDIAMVFQNYALYPHMTVADNMGFALKMAGVNKDERDKRVREAAELLGLTEFLDRKPKAMSGGQRQRVAMGRAIVRSPQVFCMDEPLSNLDAKLRVTTRTQIAALQQRLGVTTVYVTHDQVEAMTMGDRVCVLKDGLLQQVDTPLGLYDHPANLFVAGFIGSPAMNLLRGKMTESGASVNGHDMPLAITPEDRKGHSGDITIGVRPEDFVVADDSDKGIPVEVTLVEELGADAFVYGETDDPHGSEIGSGTPVVVRVEARRRFQRGSTIHVTADPKEIHVFDTETGERIGKRAGHPTESVQPPVQGSESQTETRA